MKTLSTYWKLINPISFGIMLVYAALVPHLSFSQAALPSPWQSIDIGNPTLDGSASFDEGIFAVNGAGNDIWSTSDQFHFVYQTLNGNGVITAKAESVEQTHNWAKAGLMIRSSLSANSSYAFMLRTPKDFRSFQRRKSQDIPAIGTTITNGQLTWLRLERVDQVVKAYGSADGINWQMIASDIIDLSDEVYIGLAVTSHNETSLTTAIFSEVNIIEAPTAPSDLTATATSSNSIQLNWTDNADNEDGFKIERSQSPTSGFVEIATLGADVTIYEDNSLDANTTYFYKVSALNTGGTSEEQITQAQTLPPIPDTPGNLLATATSSNSIQLNWTDNADNEDGFKIEQSTNAATGFVEIVTLGADVTNYQDQGLEPSTNYFYRIAAFNEAGSSPLSEVAEASTEEEPWQSMDIGNPTLAGSASFEEGIFIVEGAGNDIWSTSDQFHFAYQTLNGNGVITAKAESVEQTHNWAKAGLMIRNSLSANSSYAFMLRTPKDFRSFQRRKSQDIPAIGTTITNGQLTWLRLERIDQTVKAYGSTDGVNWQMIASDIIVDLSDEVYIGLAVTSHNEAALTGAVFSEVNIEELQPVETPTAPSDLLATATSSYSIQLNWTDNADIEDGFKVERSQSPTSGFVEIALLEADVNSYVDVALPPSTSYYYRISAFNVAGYSETSEIENSTTDQLISGWPQSCGIGQNDAALVGTKVTFTLGCTTDDSEAMIAWDFGDASGITEFLASASVTHVYENAGTYTIFARLEGEDIPISINQTITAPVLEGNPTHSGTIAIDHIRNIVWVVNADNNSVTGIDAVTNSKLFETPTGLHPRTVALHESGQAWIVNEEDASISVIDPTGSVVSTIDLPYGSKPYGVCFDPEGDYALVTLSATGYLLQIDFETRQTTGSTYVGPTPRGIAISVDGQRAFISRFISPEDHGEVIEVNPAGMTITQVIELAYETALEDSFQGRGVPNYVSSLTISPNGDQLWVPSKKDNVSRGGFRDGLPLTFESTVRTIVSQVDLSSNQDILENRLDINDSEMACAVTFSPLGNLAFVAMQGNNRIQIIDLASNIAIEEIEDTGLAPQGLVFNEDGSKLFVQNFMSRTVRVFDTESLLLGNYQAPPTVLATIPTVFNEILSEQVLLGKQIFYNAADPRMTSSGYLNCASCHLDGGSDERVWDFTAGGEGLRNTISLRGRRGNGIGNVHWTGNFDEIHDFENDIRNNFGGQGFLTDTDFDATADPLGTPKAGLSEDLDALVAYVNSLTEVSPSPYKNEDGSYTNEALSGKVIFENLGCGTCHSGLDYSDRPTGQLHDVGTILPSSGNRIGAPLTGFMTPTLKGIWESAPYLHDGSAATLEDVLTTKNTNGLHGNTQSLSDLEMDQLIAFLNQIDDIGGCTTQNITWESISDHAIEDQAFTIEAAATSGLAIAYSVLTGPATVDGNELTLTGLPGTVILAANQGGNNAFCAAPQETQSFKVTSECEGVAIGIYSILNNQNGSAIDGSSTTDEASQRAENAAFNRSQQWIISSLNNGYFKIENYNSLKVLSANNSTSVATPIVQETDDALNDLSQQWSVCIHESGSYQLLNRFSNLVVTNLSSTIEGSVLTQAIFNPDSTSHLWSIARITSATLPTGQYQMSALHSGKSLSLVEGSLVGKTVVQVDYTRLESQHWNLEAQGNGYVAISSASTGEYLQLPEGDISESTSVVLGSFENKDHQLWGVRRIGGLTMELFARHSGKTLAVRNGSTADGESIVQEGIGGESRQQWILTKISTNSGPGLGNLSYSEEELFQDIWHFTDEETGFGSNIATMHNGYLVMTFTPDSGQSPGGLLIWDVSNPREPVLVNRIYNNRTSTLREAHAIGQHGNYIAIQDGCGIQIWDLTDVMEPSQVTRFCMDGYSNDDYGSSWSLFWQAPYIYIGKGGGGFDIVDASNIENPVFVKNVTEQNNVGSIYAIGNLLVTGANNGNRGSAFFDISDPENPILLNSISTQTLYSLFVNGNRIITSNRHSSRKFNSFNVYSFSYPSTLTSSSSFNLGERLDQLYVSTQDNYIFQGTLNEVIKVDATNVNAMTEVGRASLNLGDVSADNGQITPLGNILFLGNDKGTGSGFVVHQKERDTKGPEVNMIVPSSGQQNRALTSRVGMTFTDFVDLQTVNTSTVIIRPVGGAAISGKYSHQFATINFTPDEPFLPETTYEVIVPAGGISDWAGNPTTTTFTSTFSTVPENISVEGMALARMQTAETLLGTDVWTVYPNTTKGEVFVKLPSSQPVISVTDVRITSIQGQSFESSFSKKPDYLLVNFTAPSGLYILQIKTINGVKLFRVIKE